MALIVCTECGKDVSEKAVSCPNCGAPISTLSSAPHTVILDKKSHTYTTRTGGKWEGDKKIKEKKRYKGTRKNKMGRRWLSNDCYWYGYVYDFKYW